MNELEMKLVVYIVEINNYLINKNVYTTKILCLY